MNLQYVFLMLMLASGYASAMYNDLNDVATQLNKYITTGDILQIKYFMANQFLNKNLISTIKQELIKDQKNRDLFIDKIIQPIIDRKINNNIVYLDEARQFFKTLQDPALYDMWRPFVSKIGVPAYASFMDFAKAYENEKDISQRQAIIGSLSESDRDNIVIASESPNSVKVDTLKKFLGLFMDDVLMHPLLTQFMSFMISLESKFKTYSKDSKKLYEEIAAKNIPFQLLLSLEKLARGLSVDFPMKDHLFEQIGGPSGDIQFIQLALLYLSQGLTSDTVIKQLATEWAKEKDSSKKNHVFTASDYVASKFGLNKGQKYTTADLLQNPAFKLEAFLPDFGFKNTILDAKELQQKMYDLGSALADIK